jgi:mono/diheme cytochrome c family protein
MPDMYRSPDYETYSPNPVFKDSMTAQQPVAGTVARANAIYNDIDRMPYPYPNTNEGYEAAGKELHNPLEKTPENLAEGKRLYMNYCVYCHGETGQADGTVAMRNGPRPLGAYNSDLYKNLPEGKIFHVTQYGKNMMGSHASQVTASQRWKIIMFVQTLQQKESTTAATAASDSTAKKKM